MMTILPVENLRASNDESFSRVHHICTVIANTASIAMFNFHTLLSCFLYTCASNRLFSDRKMYFRNSVITNRR